MKPGSHRFHSDSLFLLVLAASLAGHVSLKWLHLAAVIEPQLAQAESGRTSVSVQWIAEPPPAATAPLEPPEPLPWEVPKPERIPDLQTPEVPLARAAIPTEIFAIEPSLAAAAPPAAAVPPQLPRRLQVTESSPAAWRPAEDERAIPRQPAREEIRLEQATVEVPETVVSQASTGSEVPPAFRSRPLPEYPEQLLLQGIEGLVRLLVTVGRDGRVSSAKVYFSSGYAEMDDSALRTVRSWVFTPARRGGIPVEKTVIVPIRFKIRTEQ